ncbi:hypothetical protein V1521DRAFT_425645, partial [Lipomyces starkeyi]
MIEVCVAQMFTWMLQRGDLLVAREGIAGDVVNCTGSDNCHLTGIGQSDWNSQLKVPVCSVSREEAEARWGQFLMAFVEFGNRLSNLKAVQQLGWQPRETD